MMFSDGKVVAGKVSSPLKQATAVRKRRGDKELVGKVVSVAGGNQSETHLLQDVCDTARG